ncbi:MAG: glycosyltransferase family 2 protein [Fidelibacterota bacterium]
MNSSLVYVIVLNWNGKKLLDDCLNSLMKLDYNNYKVLLVDNASSDGSVDYVKTKFSGVEMVVLDKNYGFAGGNNEGFDYAKKNNAEYVIFINNDTIVKSNFIDSLLIPFENSQVGQTVPKIFFAEQQDKIWYAGGKINFWTGHIYHEGIRELDGIKYNNGKITDYATGCCFCMKTSIFEKLGGFDESFGMYSEDTDLSIRLKKQEGLDVYFAPDSIIYHKVSASIGGAYSFRKLKKKFRANIKLMRRHARPYQWVTQVISFPFLLIYGIMIYVLISLFYHSSSE